MSIRSLLRENIRALDPYRCARDEFEGEARVYLDANESYHSFINVKDINRYPDPHCLKLREKLEEVIGLKKEHVTVGNGSDEFIDLLFRIFCTPGEDSVLLLTPTYGAYKVFAAINDVKVHCVNLTNEFEIDVERVKKAIDMYKPKLLFICSPNNPTGNAFELSVIKELSDYNKCITVVDEAYYDFSTKESAISLADENERVVVLRTLSKAWGLAGARIGIIYSSLEISEVLYNTKYPYNVSYPAQLAALENLEHYDEVKTIVKRVIAERERVKDALYRIRSVERVYPSDSNFLLVKLDNSTKVYKDLINLGIIVRDRSSQELCASTLRVTIGSRDENDQFLKALSEVVDEV